MCARGPAPIFPWLLVLAGCAAPTSLHVQLDAAPGTTVVQLVVTATLTSPERSERRRVPDDGSAPSLPGGLLVMLPDVASDVTILVEGLDDQGSSFAEQQSTRSVPHGQVELAFLLAGKVKPSLVAPLVFQEAGAATPPGWTCVSCDPRDPFYARFPVGAATAGGLGGAETHTHQATVTLSSSPDEAGGPIGDGQAAAPAGHTHLTTVTVGAAGNLPAYRDLKIVRADQPVASLFAGAIVALDIGSASGTPPVGWEAVSGIAGQFLRGGPASTSPGGPNDGTRGAHTVSVTVLPPMDMPLKGCGGASGACAAVAAASTHTHTVSPFTMASQVLEPRHAVLQLARAAADAPIPLGAILMFEAAPPPSWTVLSSASGPLDGAFLRAGAVTRLEQVGSNSHEHAPMQAMTQSAPDPGIQAEKNLGTLAALFHRHVVSVKLLPADHRPPYREVILARRAQ